MSKNQINLRTSLRRRVGAYKRGHNFVFMLDTNFKSIFSQIQRELGLEEYDLKKIIDMASEEQIRTMHDKLSEFQLSNKYGW